MKKFKLITLVFACLFFFMGISVKAYTSDLGVKISSKDDIKENLIKYGDLYGYEYISYSGYFDAEIATDSYTMVSYPVNIEKKAINTLYVSYIIHSDYEKPSFHFGGKIELKFNNQKISFDSKAGGELEEYDNIELIFKSKYSNYGPDQAYYVYYAIDLSEYDFNTLNEVNIRYFNFYNSGPACYCFASNVYYYEVLDSEYPEDYEEHYYNYYAAFSCTANDLENQCSYLGSGQSIYFDKNYSIVNNLYLLDGLEQKGNELYLNVFTTYKNSEKINQIGMNKVKIDNQLYDLEFISKNVDECKEQYLIKDFDLSANGQHMYTLQSFLCYGALTTSSGGSQDIYFEHELNEQFTYHVNITYHRVSCMSYEYLDDPLFGYSHTYSYISLYNREIGRIENATKITLQYSHGDKFYMSKKMNYIKITKTFEVKEYDNIKDYKNENFDNGQVRKLKDEERQKYITDYEFNIFEKMTGIKGGQFYSDYEFKIKGYLLNNKVDFINVEYYNEEGSLEYGSGYKDCLNWDSEGNVYNGFGELQSNLKFNGVDIVDADGKIIEPDSTTHFDLSQKESAIKSLTVAVVDGQEDFWSKAKEAFSNLKTNANKAGIIVASVVGLLFVLLLIKLLIWIFKK